MNGLRLIAAAAGRDETPVLPGDAVIEAKSVSRGTTTRRDMETPDDVRAVMFALCEDIGHKLLLCRQKACGVAVYARDNQPLAFSVPGASSRADRQLLGHSEGGI